MCFLKEGQIVTVQLKGRKCDEKMKIEKSIHGQKIITSVTRDDSLELPLCSINGNRITIFSPKHEETCDLVISMNDIIKLMKGVVNQENHKAILYDMEDYCGEDRKTKLNKMKADYEENHKAILYDMEDYCGEDRKTKLNKMKADYEENHMMGY